MEPKVLRDFSKAGPEKVPDKYISYSQSFDPADNLAADIELAALAVTEDAVAR